VGPLLRACAGRATRYAQDYRRAATVAVAAAAVTFSTPVHPLQTYAIENVTVIPMDRERRLERHTVVVSDGRITVMSPSARARVPNGATRIDVAASS